ncbi:hypothetical protein HMPREF1550_01946 [Actinomyces sp. oral taxon 877 str. F0543]|nr:hypothetical protein HMPREF1550_01946 [Actinomyces sp. oral taxon 877 str. F0543]
MIDRGSERQSHTHSRQGAARGAAHLVREGRHGFSLAEDGRTGPTESTMRDAVTAR